MPLVRTIYVPQRLKRLRYANPQAGVRALHPAPAGSPAFDLAAAPQTKAGEIVLTQGQKLALLVMRQSDLSKKILAGIIDKTKQGPACRDFYSCANLGLAVNKGRYHVLTMRGRWLADFVAIEIAKQFDMHIITYDLGSREHGRGAFAKCSCGWRGMYRSLGHSYAVLIGRDAAAHLATVASKQSEAKAS